MYLTLFINPTGHHQASWRHPRAQADAGVNFTHYAEVAQLAERARFDAVFLADGQSVREGDPATVSRVAQYVANFEPLTVIAAMAAVTERIGFIATASTTYGLPYQIARMFASLDHISGGRVGWNVVTSQAPDAANFGFREHLEHEARYERAAEFVEVCLGLWDSWEDDAFPRDKRTGVFSFPEKQHHLDHHGRYLSVRGPLNVPRPPQGYPLLVQAGSSPTGIAFAARYADMVFTTPQTLDEACTVRRKIREGAAANGRDPDCVKVMPGLAALAGADDAAAEADHAQLQELLHPDVAINILSLKINADVSDLPLNEPLPAGREPAGSGAVYFRQWHELGRREGLTLRELAQRAAGSRAGVEVRGSGKRIADFMEEWFVNDGADGFNVMPAYLPGALEDFVKYVSPELRRRGLVQHEYQGRTLREHFDLPRPEWNGRGYFRATR